MQFMASLRDFEPAKAHPLCEVRGPMSGAMRARPAAGRPLTAPISCLWGCSPPQSCDSEAGAGLCRGCTEYLCAACCVGPERGGLVCRVCGLLACARCVVARCAVKHATHANALRVMPCCG